MAIPKGIKRVICLLLAVCFFGQSALTCYAQALMPTLTPPVLNFSLPTLKYLSVNSANPCNYFNFLLDKGQSPRGAVPVTNVTLEKEAKKLIRYFFVGLTLPESSLWVNLRPDEPGRITSLELAQTDMGKLLLEQDLRLKKDVAQYLNPRDPIGKRFWEELYCQAELLLGKGKLKKTAIATSNRVWIVPDEAVVMETEDGALVTRARLKVLLESEYLSLKAKSWNKEIEVQSQNKGQLKKLTEALMKSIIIPEITKEVNSGKSYASLRQIYHSLILARWFKQKYKKQKKDGKDIPYIEAIDQSWLGGLQSEFPWSKDAVWQEYLASFQKGEYQLKEKLSGLNRMYISGGILINFGVDPKTGSSPLRVIAYTGATSPIIQNSIPKDNTVLITTERRREEVVVGGSLPETTIRTISASSPVEQEDKGGEEALRRLIGLLNIEKGKTLNIAAIKQMLEDRSLFDAIPELKALDVESSKDPGHTAGRRIDHVVDALEFFEGLPGNVLGMASDGQANQIKEGISIIREKIGQSPNNLYLLRLAILLHDIGKRPEKKPLDASHEEHGAADLLPLILGRIEGLTDEDRETISYLVAHHSALSFFSQKRDISNSDFVVEAADVLGEDLKRIEMLYLLSIADFVAVDTENNRNNSIGILALAKTSEAISAELYKKGGLERVREEAEEGYLSGMLPEFGEKIKKLYLGFVGLPFVAGAGLKRMRDHLSLLEDVLLEKTAVKLSRLIYYDNTQYTELAVGVPQDKPGLLRLITGILVDRGYDIHLARIDTAGIDGRKIVFDRFLIRRDPDRNDGENDMKSRNGLDEVMVNEINAFLNSNGAESAKDFTDEIIKGARQKLPKLTGSKPEIDFKEKDGVTQMTIETTDVMGLLFRIMDILSKRDINLLKAQIKTRGFRVGNIFFIQKDGLPLEDELRRSLSIELEEGFAASSPVEGHGESAFSKAPSSYPEQSSSPIAKADSKDAVGGIDLSRIEVTLKDEKFVSQLNSADIKVLRAAKYLKEGWGSLSLLYVHEIMLILKDNTADKIKQEVLFWEVLKQLRVKGFTVPEIRFTAAG